MSRLMSVAFTEQAVVDRLKVVSRRKGWWEDKRGRRLLEVGDRLTLCRKVMGRKPGEPLVRLAEVEVIHVRREPLYELLLDGGYGRDEMVREGFPGMSPVEFIARYFTAAQRIHVADDVTRIRWQYLDTYTRPFTDTARLPGGGSRVTVKRCCNGCGRELGDATEAELDAAMVGRPLPDVRDECGRHDP